MQFHIFRFEETGEVSLLIATIEANHREQTQNTYV